MEYFEKLTDSQKGKINSYVDELFKRNNGKSGLEIYLRKLKKETIARKIIAKIEGK